MALPSGAQDVAAVLAKRADSATLSSRREDMTQYLIAALYQFVSLPDFRELRGALDRLCRQRGITGSILLAHEGINGTLAGQEDDMRFVLAELRRDARLAGLKHKESWATEPPFLRLKVRLKKEIVTLGVAGVDPTARVGSYVKPKDWNALISEPGVLLIDARNTYETKLGTFKGATDPQTESFNEFPQWVKEHDALTPKTRVAMFCTGGIRCEKASSYMLQEGFEEVYHLEGGILRYLEDVPKEESLWEGDCYVFDRRVSVNHDLKPGTFDACRACGLPLDDQDKASPLYVKGVACPYCHGLTSDESKERFAERQRQTELATERGQEHLGLRQSQHRREETD
jgi:UPF0176 protein